MPSKAEPVSLRYRFTTAGKLQVSSVFPTDGAKEIALDGAIMVQPVDFTAIDGCTANSTGVCASRATGAKAFSPSYGSLRTSGLMVRCVPARRMV